MYTPDRFRVDDLDTLHAFMAQNSFGTLVTHENGVPFATHIPVHVDLSSSRVGLLSTHIARANPQWRHISESDVLVIFHGPHAYVSPSWYESELMVPTWNYAAVHAYGRARIVDDAGLHAILEKMVDQYESGRPEPWRMSSLPAEFVEKLRRAIVGIEIEITRRRGSRR